jgi:hypothetical protein
MPRTRKPLINPVGTRSTASQTSHVPFRALMTEAAPSVASLVKLHQDLGWMNDRDSLHETLRRVISGLDESFRYLGDLHDLRRRLARIAAVCEAWDKHLNP